MWHDRWSSWHIGEVVARWWKVVKVVHWRWTLIGREIGSRLHLRFGRWRSIHAEIGRRVAVLRLWRAEFVCEQFEEEAGKVEFVAAFGDVGKEFFVFADETLHFIITD